MKFWKENVDRILTFNDQPILVGKGEITNEQMKQELKELYKQFNSRRKIEEARLADQQDLKALEEKIKKNRSKGNRNS